MPLFACLSLLSFFGMTATQLTSSMDRFWLWIVLTCDNWTCSTTIWALHWSRDFTYYLKLAILIHCQSLDPALKCLLITMASELDSLWEGGVPVSTALVPAEDDGASDRSRSSKATTTASGKARAKSNARAPRGQANKMSPSFSSWAGTPDA